MATPAAGQVPFLPSASRARAFPYWKDSASRSWRAAYRSGRWFGPTETRRTSKHDFIHTMDGTRALIAAAGLHDLAGFKLDVHHWKHSGAGLLDLHHCDSEYLLYVELNDGAAGHDRFTMPEFARELPLATGVNDVAGFLKALHRKGYQGPVVVEPWNQRIRDLPLCMETQRLLAWRRAAAGSDRAMRESAGVQRPVPDRSSDKPLRKLAIETKTPPDLTNGVCRQPAGSSISLLLSTRGG